ncbi:hypothetical protein B0H19DRAFT_1260660 [Mycena capillaripes]|nr:hypothetical protein B0H19DRAFT_1260660 [Mycena capillaripes]
MSANPDLAQELVDTIVDFLHDDRGSLLSSSLVARNWVPATRHHVFERITINHFFTGRAGRGFRDTAHPFLAICRSPYCTITSGIQSVLLNIEVPSHAESDSSLALLEELVEALARTPVSKILFIDHTKSFAAPISLSWIPSRLPGLREFAYNALDRFVLDIFTLVAAFPELRSLALYSTTRDASAAAITQAKPHSILPSAHTAFAHLHTLRLRLRGDQADEFVMWLLNLGGHIRLETLDLSVFHFYHDGWGPVGGLNTFFGAHGAHLRDLNLSILYEDNADLDEELLLDKPSDGEVDLSNLTNLHSLRLGGHDVSAICRALASLPSPSPPLLETLEVSFKGWIHYADVPCACDARVLVHDFTSVMRGAQFAALTRFAILVPEFFGEEGAELLKDYFPRWKGTEVLSVGFIDQFRYPVDSWEGVRDELVGVVVE